MAAEGSVTIDVLENAAFPADPGISVTVTDKREGVTIDATGAVVEYTPAAGLSGADSFDYTVSDAASSFTVTGTAEVLGLHTAAPPPPDAPP